MANPSPICRRLLLHPAAFAWALARVNIGSSNAANIAMMAMTVRSSIRVNAIQIRTPLAPLPLIRFIVPTWNPRRYGAALSSRFPLGFFQNWDQCTTRRAQMGTAKSLKSMLHGWMQTDKKRADDTGRYAQLQFQPTV